MEKGKVLGGGGSAKNGGKVYLLIVIKRKKVGQDQNADGASFPRAVGPTQKTSERIRAEEWKKKPRDLRKEVQRKGRHKTIHSPPLDEGRQKKGCPGKRDG